MTKRIRTWLTVVVMTLAIGTGGGVAWTRAAQAEEVPVPPPTQAELITIQLLQAILQELMELNDTAARLPPADAQ